MGQNKATRSGPTHINRFLFFKERLQGSSSEIKLPINKSPSNTWVNELEVGKVTTPSQDENVERAHKSVITKDKNG